MSTSGADVQQARRRTRPRQPAGTRAAPTGRPEKPLALVRLTSRPDATRTPVSGSAASSTNVSRVVGAHADSGSLRVDERVAADERAGDRRRAAGRRLGGADQDAYAALGQAAPPW